MEKERAGGMAYLARRLGETGELREDVTVEQAADMLWVLCSFDTFDALCTQRGLSLEQTTELTVGMAERAVCRPNRRRGGASL
jgi:hypothetical protein